MKVNTWNEAQNIAYEIAYEKEYSCKRKDIDKLHKVGCELFYSFFIINQRKRKIKIKKNREWCCKKHIEIDGKEELIHVYFKNKTAEEVLILLEEKEQEKRQEIKLKFEQEKMKEKKKQKDKIRGEKLIENLIEEGFEYETIYDTLKRLCCQQENYRL